jgi:hypothetical protein
MSDRVAIIGCGPAGLLAAHAAVLKGFDPVIYAPKVKPSPTPPAVFIHKPIIGVSDEEPDAMVKIKRVGFADGYAQKAYGDSRHPTSFDRLPCAMPAWAFAPIYERLWGMYHGLVREDEVMPSGVDSLLDEYPTVMNTAPLPRLCKLSGVHAFPSRDLWITDQAPIACKPNTMIYNGDRHASWVRCSSFFGVESTEYPRRPQYNVGVGVKVMSGLKVMPTDCDCHPRLVRLGRWGRWMPGVLLHHAFEDAGRALDAQRLLTETFDA